MRRTRKPIDLYVSTYRLRLGLVTVNVLTRRPDGLYIPSIETLGTGKRPAEYSALRQAWMQGQKAKGLVVEGVSPTNWEHLRQYAFLNKLRVDRPITTEAELLALAAREDNPVIVVDAANAEIPMALAVDHNRTILNGAGVQYLMHQGGWSDQIAGWINQGHVYTTALAA